MYYGTSLSLMGTACLKRYRGTGMSSNSRLIFICTTNAKQMQSNYKATAEQQQTSFVCLHHINVSVQHMQVIWGQAETC